MRCVTGVGYNFMKRNNKLNKKQVHRRKGQRRKNRKINKERHKKRRVIFWVNSRQFITAEELLRFQEAMWDLWSTSATGTISTPSAFFLPPL